MAPFSFPRFFKEQFTKLPEASRWQTDLSGKTIIVTAANIGLGWEAARHLARMNPGKLILACRDAKKGMDAVQSIVKDTGCTTVDCWTLDLADFESIKAFSERFDREDGGKLDILIENAGIATEQYKQATNGWETTLQVNHLGTSLLAFRLLPYLLKAPASPPAPRLVIVSSDLHMLVTELKEADSPKVLERLNDQVRCQEKGSERSFVRALASHIPRTSPLTVNAVAPGFCYSGLTREVHHIFFDLFQRIVARTTESGSRTYVHAALGPDVQGLSGQYLKVCKVGEASDFVLSEKGMVVQQRLWDETLEILFKADAKVPEIVRTYLS